jgi:hypothetical protein
VQKFAVNLYVEVRNCYLRIGSCLSGSTVSHKP